MHFGGVWGVVGREEFGGFGSCRDRVRALGGTAGGGVGVVEELSADGMRLTGRGEGRGAGGSAWCQNAMRLRVSRDRSRQWRRRIGTRGLDDLTRAVETGARGAEAGIVGGSRGPPGEGCMRSPASVHLLHTRGKFQGEVGVSATRWPVGRRADDAWHPGAGCQAHGSDVKRRVGWAGEPMKAEVGVSAGWAGRLRRLAPGIAAGGPRRSR